MSINWPLLWAVFGSAVILFTFWAVVGYGFWWLAKGLGWL